KDDLDTAFRHLELYDRFGCPGEHVQVSFRCVVRQGNIDQKDQKATDAFNKRVHDCWLDPALPAVAAAPPATAAEKPGTK
ncbi:MAG TPA: beta-1-3, beta-1-6-glucan biosynthesis protein, partial [Xanthobacteraceae bacterium]|nr:beta-1-3, beta-1-6-glucan biosynthesis protein [Xanthobacteraceae bacterium]